MCVSINTYVFKMTLARRPVTLMEVWLKSTWVALILPCGTQTLGFPFLKLLYSIFAFFGSFSFHLHQPWPLKATTILIAVQGWHDNLSFSAASRKPLLATLCVCISMCICKCVFLWQFYWNVIHTAYNLPFKVYDSFFLVYSQHIVQLSPLSNYRTFSSP